MRERKKAAALVALVLLGGGAWWLSRRSAAAAGDGAGTSWGAPLSFNLDDLLGSPVAVVDSVQASVYGAYDDIVNAITPDPVNADANVRAFAEVVSRGEGTSGPDGYRTLFGGELFDSFADHPRRVITRTLGGRPISSTAAGKYQALSTTWDDFTRAVGARDFSPASQDEFFLWCLRRRGALADVRAGRFDAAIAKCAREWASLPGSPYGQPTITLASARATYESAGGVYA